MTAGETYNTYRDYVRENYRRNTVLLGHDALIGSGMVVAPHLLARKPLYEQIADDELPTTQDLQFVPVLPDRQR